ncbi:MAG: OadG family protein [Treponema sp.]|nr:OadG family protein [Treponema sp.]
MTINEMLGQSGLLTLLGMCVVFSFIIILIISMKLLQVIVHATKLDKKDAAETTSSAPATPAATADNGAIVAAIAAAIKMKDNK